MRKVYYVHMEDKIEKYKIEIIEQYNMKRRKCLSVLIQLILKHRNGLLLYSEKGVRKKQMHDFIVDKKGVEDVSFWKKVLSLSDDK